MILAKPGKYYRGFFTCSCGLKGGSYDLILPGNIKTNKLAIHYVEYHRSEIPLKEIEKINKLYIRYFIKRKTK